MSFGLVGHLVANGITVNDEKYLEQHEKKQKASSARRSGKRKKQKTQVIKLWRPGVLLYICV